MRPSDQVLVASSRWLDLLRRSSLSQAWVLIGSDPRYADLSRTQYHAGLEWLLERGLAVESTGFVVLGPRTGGLSPVDADAELMADAVETDQPPWLFDADELVISSTDLPADVENLADALCLPPDRAFQAIRRAQQKVDVEMRQRVGALGELALLQALEERWPASATHVSATDDTAGYDISINLLGNPTHIEVKSTNRRGRLVVYLSRHEFETGLLDPAWRLVVVGIDSEGRLGALATVRAEALQARAPLDQDPRGRWDSTRFTLGSGDLDPGLRPCGADDRLDAPSAVAFAWMPADGRAGIP